MAPLAKQLARGRLETSPLIGAIVDSGLQARLAWECGADLLFALSAGPFRQIGVSTLGSFLPFQDGNAVALQVAREQVIPAAPQAAIVLGMIPGAAEESQVHLFEELHTLGIAGVMNYPTVTLIDGSLRQIYEESGVTIDSEIELLRAAARHGLTAIGFVAAEPSIARRYAESGLDALVISLGHTRELQDLVEHRDRVEQAVQRLNAVATEVHAACLNLPCLAFGGPIVSPEDLESLMRHGLIDGFVGGSVFVRLPVEKAIRSAIRRFKSIRGKSVEGERQGLGPLIGESPVMRQLFRLIERAAEYELHVCLEGESGTGKELVATQIHRMSRRQHGPLVTLNCGAIPDSLLESELFGHERGAFTGAERRRPGKFELASGGTLFLDEVGDLSPRGQVALLRAIQQREVTRVGGETPLEVDCRIICATNQPLAQLVAAGRFREDLYFRLNNLNLRVPPLRERLEDLPLLVKPILAGLAIQLHRRFEGLSSDFYEKLDRHAWRGNVRELQHVIYQAAFLEEGPILDGSGFSPLALTPNGMTSAEANLPETAPVPDYARQNRRERQIRAQQAVASARGNKSQAAAVLGISRKTLYQWLQGEREA